MALIIPIKNIKPEIHDTCWLAPNSTVIGQVTMKANSTVWFNAVIRGDVNTIEIGVRSNIQDAAVIHCTYNGASTSIGDDVTIGHTAIIHGCKIGNHALIGMGAVVMDNAEIGDGAIIGAGAVVKENTIVPPYTLWAGVPAKQVKILDKDKMKAYLEKHAANYVMYAEWYE